jgi:hypothetical protein
MKSIPHIVGMLLLVVGPASSGGPPLEEALLFSPHSPGAWAPSESKITSGNSGGEPVLEWAVVVDHKAGEADYPIGWPRIVAEVDSLRDWSAWDYVEFRARTTASRTSLPSEPAGLILFDTDGDRILTRPLTELRLNEWVSFRLLTASLLSAGAVGRMQFYIAERNYSHGDRLHFAIDRISLSRHTAPALVDVLPSAHVVFSDIGHISLQIRLSGLKDAGSTNIVCEVVRENGVVASMVRSVSNGLSTLVLPLPQGLSPGACTLRTRVEESEDLSESPLHVVASPWR